MEKLVLTQEQLDIFKGKICPYCKGSTQYVDSAVIYGRSFGMIYLCKPCDAWCGVHKSESQRALGRLANAELRELKKQAHAAFDPLWKTGKMSRTQAYKQLSNYLKIEKRFTHIGMFSPKTCLRVIEFTKAKQARK